MRVTEHRGLFQIGAGAAVLAAWLVLGAAGLPGPSRINLQGPVDLLLVLAWFAAAAAVAGVAGRRQDAVAAFVAWTAGVLGAVVVAWAHGVPEVLPGADPAMRAGYHQMVIVIAAGFAGIVGSLVVVFAYRLGRMTARRRSAQPRTFGTRPPRAGS